MSEYNIIEEYSVKKIYPSKINIKIKPTKLVARVFSSNKLIVGSNGKLIQGEETSEILPYVSGKFDTKKFLELKRNIENSKFNFSDFKIKYDGGPFTAVGYCWDQAIQFLPKKLRDKKKKWLANEMKNFINLDKKYKKNKVRKNTIFPMSFSIEAKLKKK